MTDKDNKNKENSHTGPTTSPSDPEAWLDTMSKLGAGTMTFWSKYWPNLMQQGMQGRFDPLGLQVIFEKMLQETIKDPNQLLDFSSKLMAQYIDLYTRFIAGETAQDTQKPSKDRRFKDDNWDSHPGFRFIKEAYLLSVDWLKQVPENANGLNPHEKQKLDFFVRQFVDALSPTNFVMTNPDVMQETLQTNGANLARGMENFLNDLDPENGRLKVSMVPDNAFTLGENIAITEGDVVFRNDLIELIRYQPTTETVSAIPLLIIPPCINKFYILDLRPENSFIRWAVSQGQQVYVISWVNPGKSHAEKDYSDYIKSGPLAAIDTIKHLTGQTQINAIGYCMGGTLLAMTLAWLEAKGRKDVLSATYFATLVDFTEPGELGVFIDDAQIRNLEQKMAAQGFMDGADLAMSFNSLRANDLIWSFVINNYLMGKEPFPFDLLYWNSDSTRLPARMYSWYLRKLYLENTLVQPGSIKVDGTAIDLGKIKTPSFILATRDDHIAPWQSCFKATGLYGGAVKFVLAGSGHIAGVINPPTARKKYGFWENNRRYKNADNWLDKATYQEGSWWPTWHKWLEKHAGTTLPVSNLPPTLKNSLGKAPGDYVRMR